MVVACSVGRCSPQVRFWDDEKNAKDPTENFKQYRLEELFNRMAAQVGMHAGVWVCVKDCCSSDSLGHSLVLFASADVCACVESRWLALSSISPRCP